MSKRLLTLSALAALLLSSACALPALAADPHKKAEARPFSAQEKAAISQHFQQEQREREQYAQYHESGKDKKQGKTKSLPPGLQKKAASGRLPPGWEKKLQRGQMLSPEVYAVAEPLPAQLVAQLPIGPLGSVTVRVEGKIVRLLEATHEIIDILDL